MKKLSIIVLVLLFNLERQVANAEAQTPPESVGNNEIRYATAFRGNDAGEKIVAAISKTPDSGGIVDARGLGDSQRWDTCPFSGITKPLTILLGVGMTSITSDCTVPSNITLSFPIGSVIDVEKGKTLRIAGGTEGSLTKHFSGSVVLDGTTNIGAVYPQWFGATGDGMTDNANAFARLIAALPAFGGGKVLVPAGTYNFESEINLQNRNSIAFQCEAGGMTSGTKMGCTFDYTARFGNLINVSGSRGIQFSGFNFKYSNAAYASNLIETDGTGHDANTSTFVLRNNRIGGSNDLVIGAPCLINIELANHIDIVGNNFQNAASAICGTKVSYINANSINIERNYFDAKFSDTMIKAGGQTWVIQANTFEPREGITRTAQAITITPTGLKGLSIIANWFGDALRGTWVNFENPADGFVVIGNLFGGGTTGLSLGTSTGGDIRSNRFENLTNGIVASASSTVDVGPNSYLTVTTMTTNPSKNSMVINSSGRSFAPVSGNVGINTPVPLVPLHVGAGSIFDSLPNGAGGVFTSTIAANTTSGISGISVGVTDGVHNRRSSLFVNETNGVWGLSTTYSQTAIPFVIDCNKDTECLRFTTTGALRLPQYTTAGAVVNDANGNITSTIGLNTTISIRNNAESGTCTITFSNGIATASTC